MDDKLGGLASSPCGQLGVECLVGVVGEGGDDASVGFAVTGEVDITRVRWCVVGVDEVEVLGEAAPFGVTDGVGPAGYLGEVVFFSRLEDFLEVGLCRVGDEATCKVGSGDVAQACIILVVML